MIKHIITLFAICITTVLYSQIKDTVQIGPIKQESLKRQMLDSLWIREATGGITPEERRQTYLKLLKLDPRCDLCYYKMSSMYLEAGMFKQALPAARNAYQLDSTNSWYQLNYARASHSMGDFVTAQRLFRGLLKTQGDIPDVWVSLASSYEEQEQYDRALGVLDSMQRRFGESDDLLYRLHNIYYSQQKFDKAIECAQTLMSRNSYDVRFATLLADTYSAANSDSKAIESYDKAIKMDPNFSPAFLGKAEILRKKGKFDDFFLVLNLWAANPRIDPKGKADYLKLILDIPSFPQFYFKEFDRIFVLAQTAHGTNDELIYLKAQYLARIDKMDLAIIEARKLTELEINNITSWRLLTSLLYTVSKWNELSEEAWKARTIYPNESGFYNLEAIGLTQQGKVKAAIKTMKETDKIPQLSLDEKSKNALYIADLYAQSGKKKDAYQYYERSLQFDSLNTTTLNNYAYYLSVDNKDLDKALDMSLKSLQIEKDNFTFMDTYAYILFLKKQYVEAKSIFRQALALGGTDSSVILEHYADTLAALGEKDLAVIYWNRALSHKDCENKEELNKKIKKSN